MMSINPDAHSTREIDLTHWGVEMARARAACPKISRKPAQASPQASAPGGRIPRARATSPKQKKDLGDTSVPDPQGPLLAAFAVNRKRVSFPFTEDMAVLQGRRR
jgi:hypothetical protein